ncbi:MAG: glutamate racemase [Ghiorsea sp.]|nr:glutamate racemase [Ghiorsea sp.]
MNNPIGIFDSGLGGLTVLREMQAAMSHEHFVYVADSAYAPYGNKDSQMVLQRSLYIAKELQQTHHIQALVVACNTATAVAVHQLRETLNIPVIGMEPALKPAVEQSESGIVGILATENTLKSDKFSNLLDMHQHQARILTQPCAGLVEAVELGDLNSRETKALLASYVLPLIDKGVDTLVLGCTHYPWLESMIRELVGADVSIMSTGKAVAKQVKKQINGNVDRGQGETLFYTTSDAGQVSQLASSLLQSKVVFQSFSPQHSEP